MMNEHDVHFEGVRTDEWVWGRSARVWWDQEAFLAFPTVEDRREVLSYLETEMINCGTATLYYHAAEVGKKLVLFDSAEDAEVICINVRLGQPIMLTEEMVAMLREFFEEQEAAAAKDT